MRSIKRAIALELQTLIAKMEKTDIDYLMKYSNPRETNGRDIVESLGNRISKIMDLIAIDIKRGVIGGGIDICSLSIEGDFIKVITISRETGETFVWFLKK